MPLPPRALANEADVAHWARHMQGRQLLAEVCEALGRHVGVMPLKGILFSALGLVDPAQRPLADLDVLLFDVNLLTAARRLARAGFVVTEVPIGRGKLSMAPRSRLGLAVDLHTRVMPAGQGRFDPSDLLRGATLRRDLFATPVLVPTLENVALHAVANIIKDRIVHANPHVAGDLARVLERLAPTQRKTLAAELERVSLSDSGALALTWANELCPSVAVVEVLGYLCRPHASTSTGGPGARLQALRTTDHFGVGARVRGRACADAPGLRLLAAGSALVDLATWPLRHSALRWVAPSRTSANRR